MRLDPAGDQTLNGGLTLPKSYELCRQVQRSHSRTYYFSTQLFPPEVRPHVHALYAFIRYADEIVDNPHDSNPEEQLSSLNAFEDEMIAAIGGEDVANPVLRAFANTARARSIELESITAFMESMKMDTRVSRYETYEDLEAYTYGSAAIVGLMMSRVIGVTDGRSTPHAEALGVAMQLSNFLRDIGEDWMRGRIYLPLEDLARFEYGEDDLAAKVVDERFVGLMEFEIERTRAIYDFAGEGMGYIPRGRRFPVLVARELYEAILDRIQAQCYEVYSQRADTSQAYKIGVMAKVAAREPGEILARGMDRAPAEIAIPS